MTELKMNPEEGNMYHNYRGKKSKRVCLTVVSTKANCIVDVSLTTKTEYRVTRELSCIKEHRDCFTYRSQWLRPL